MPVACANFARINGLVQKPELNGKYAAVLGKIDNGRYPVSVRDTASNEVKSFKIKPHNLTVQSLHEVCEGLPHVIQINDEEVTAKSVEEFVPLLSAVQKRLRSMPQDDGFHQPVKDIACYVELSLAKCASFSSAGFPAAKVEELHKYFFERHQHVTPQTSWLGAVMDAGPECLYYLCYVNATQDLLNFSYRKTGAFEKAAKFCSEWLAHDEKRVSERTLRCKHVPEMLSRTSK
ncbi:unnamed protein product [Amoebophrya sp. A25]|nr:unnamed protein product [Amoebophrya sp. A25]|eukprot:GSA25T00001808001.1